MVVISSIDVVSRLRVTFVSLISHGLCGRLQVVTALLVLCSSPRSDIALSRRQESPDHFRGKPVPEASI